MGATMTTIIEPDEVSVVLTRRELATILIAICGPVNCRDRNLEADLIAKLAEVASVRSVERIDDVDVGGSE